MKVEWEWWGMSTTQDEIIAYTYASVALLSMAGSLFIIATFALFKHLRTFTNLLVVLLATSDLLAATADVMNFGVQRNAIGCQVQGYLMQFADVSSFLWVMCISIHAYLAICWGVSLSRLKRLFPVYCIAVYGFPAATVGALALVRGIGHVSDGAYSWCWVTDKTAWARFALFYVPLLAMWVLCGVLYVLIARTLAGVSVEMKGSANRRLSLYMSVFIMCSFFGLVNRVFGIFYTKPVFWLYLIQSLADSSRGFFNAVVYGLNKSRTRTITKVLSRLICFCIPASEGTSMAVTSSRSLSTAYTAVNTGAARLSATSALHVSDDEVAELWDTEVEAVQAQSYWAIQAKDAYVVDVATEDEN